MHVRGWVSCDEVGDLDLDRDRFESAGKASERSETLVEQDVCALKLVGFRMVEGSYLDEVLGVVLTKGGPEIFKGALGGKIVLVGQTGIVLVEHGIGGKS